MRIAAVIVAGGRGSRLSGATATAPKQYLPVGGRAVIAHAIAAFVAHPAITDVIAVIHADDATLYDNAVLGADVSKAKLRAPVIGGATRQQSVAAGLESLAHLWPPSDETNFVLIHDAARPFVTADVISRVIESLRHSSAVLAATPVTDTLKRATTSNVVTDTIDRRGLWRAQTPQGFRFATILDAHRKAVASGQHDFTDDAALVEWSGQAVSIVLGSERNSKITTAEDLMMANARMTNAPLAVDVETRTATGFDIHRFTDGDHVWLGGVKIEHSARLDGHSDADVVLHALTDALLGTIGDGDIGQHFPPSDPQWKGAASIMFLADAKRRVAERGGRIVNVDVTILAEAPKVGPHRAAMQAVIGAALGLSPGRIGIKATTMEGLGAIGRREGIAAMASATVVLPCEDKA